jgi:hypothetical protein
MRSRTGLTLSFILRRGLLALAIIMLGWAAAFASGLGVLTLRSQLHVEGNRGDTVTCRYLHATGRYEITDFTEHPEAADCAKVVSVRSPPLSGDQWAAPFDGNQTVRLYCRFLMAPTDGDGGLGTRFGGDAPLRLTVNLAARRLTLSDDDRRALGEPAFDKPSSPNANNAAVGWILFSPGTTPPLAAHRPVDLILFSRDGQASLMLRGPHGWARQGGCRTSA